MGPISESVIRHFPAYSTRRSLSDLWAGSIEYLFSPRWSLIGLIIQFLSREPTNEEVKAARIREYERLSALSRKKSKNAEKVQEGRFYTWSQ
jgi:hypothetical protein